MAAAKELQLLALDANEISEAGVEHLKVRLALLLKVLCLRCATCFCGLVSEFVG